MIIDDAMDLAISNQDVQHWVERLLSLQKSSPTETLAQQLKVSPELQKFLNQLEAKIKALVGIQLKSDHKHDTYYC